jgi:hypothetical protein
MKKLFFLLAILLLPMNTISMGWSGWYEYKDVYIFGIQLLRNKELKNLIYNYPYYNNYNCTPGNEKNIAEWQQRYPQVKQDSFFHQFIYRASFRKVDSVLIAIKTKEKNPLAKNLFAHLLYKRKDIKALEYLVFAKKCEPFVVSAEYGWEDGDEPRTAFNEPDKVEDSMTLGLQKIKETKDKFLRQRYVFQVVRLAYRTNESEKAIQYFDKFADHKNKTYMYYRALIHKGFALQSLKKDSEANKIFAQIFNSSPELRCFAYRSFTENFYDNYYYSDNRRTEEENKKITQGNADWEKSISSTKDKDILQMLCVMRAATLFDLQPAVLSAAYKADADLSILEMLAIKQLKVAETQLFLPSLRGFITFDTTKLQYGQNNVNLALYKLHTKLSKKEQENEEVSTPITQTTQIEPEVKLSFFTKIWAKIVTFFDKLFGTEKEVEKPKIKPKIIPEIKPETVTKQVAKILPTPLVTENSPLIRLEKSRRDSWHYPTYQKKDNDIQDITKSEELKQLLKICEKIATEKKSAFFYLASAYLNVMLKNHNNSLKQIVIAQKLLLRPKADEPKDFIERLKNQATYLELLATVHKTDKITPEIGEKLAQNLPKLWKNQAENDNYAWQRTLLFYLIAKKYLQQGENVKAALAAYAHKSRDLAANILDIYSNENDIAIGIRLFQNPKKTAFENYLISHNHLTINMLRDLQATHLCRKGEFSKGLAIMEKIDKSYWKSFEISQNRWWDKVAKTTYHQAEFGGMKIVSPDNDTENEESGMVTYEFALQNMSDSLKTSFLHSPLDDKLETKSYNDYEYKDLIDNCDAQILKIDFLRKIVALEKQAQTVEKAGKKDEAAKLYMQMANGFYHTKLWQYNTHLWENHNVGSHSIEPYELNWKTATQASEMQNRYDYFGKIYACRYLAAILYQKAANLATDKKLIAENLYAQATALRRQSYNDNLGSSQNHIDFSYNNAIHKLLENYQDTEILDSLLGKCPLLKDYQVQ